MRQRAVGLLAVSIAFGLVQGSVQPARAATCDTSWAAPVDGNYDQPASWTDGVPTLARTACLPAFDGTSYTVTIRDDRSVAASLDIAPNVVVRLTDGPGGARFEAANGIHNAGTMTVEQTHSGAYDLETGAGALVNDGGGLLATTPITVSSMDNTAGTVDASADVRIARLVNLVSGQLSGGSLIANNALIEVPEEVRTLASAVDGEGDGVVVTPDGRPALRDLALVTPAGSLSMAFGVRIATSAQLHNAGRVAVQGGSKLEADGGYVQDAGRTDVEGTGTLLALGGGLRNLGGVLALAGTGHVIGNVVNKAAISVESGVSPSLLEGTLTEARSGTLTITSNTPLVVFEVTGPVQLAGTLVARSDGLLAPGAQTTLLTSPTIAGTAKLQGDDFDVTVGPALITARRNFVAPEDDPAVSYGGWHAAPSTLAADGLIHESETTGDTATANVHDLAAWDGELRPDGGVVDVLVDGILRHGLPAYAATTSRLVDRLEFAGDRTLAIRVNGATPPFSTGSWVSVDDARELAGTVDDSDFSYDGWSLVHDGARTYRLSSQPGVPATLAFNGTSVEWLTQTGPDRGRATVLIDGVAHPVFDLYSRARKNDVVEGFFGLAAGPHTLQIVPLATANRRSTGTGVVVDRFVAR